jgi:hypothetical protein
MFEGHCEQFSNPRFVCDLVSCLATTGFSSADVTGLPDCVRALAGIIMDAAVDSGITLASTQGISYNVAMFTSTLMISSGLLSLLRPWRARVHRGDADGETPQTPTELMIAAVILDHAWMILKLLRKFRLDVNTTDETLFPKWGAEPSLAGQWLPAAGGDGTWAARTGSGLVLMRGDIFAASRGGGAGC